MFRETFLTFLITLTGELWTADIELLKKPWWEESNIILKNDKRTEQ